MSIEDQIAQLQAQTTVAPQPSFMGVQAPPDPNQLRALLQKLQSQQAVDQASTPSGGEWGFLRDAGRGSFAQVGQGLGGAVSGALNPQPTGPSPQQAAQSQALMAARQQYTTAVANGADENVAAQAAARSLVAAGFPAAPEVLEKAIKAGQDAAHVTGETNHNNAQADAQRANIVNQDREAKQNTWTDVKELPLGTLQVNGLGEKRFVKTDDKSMIPPTEAQEGDLKSAARDVANYSIPESSIMGRGSNPDTRAHFHTLVMAENPDYDQKNFKASSDAVKAYGPSGQQYPLVIKTQNAMNHLAALKEWGKALKEGDSQTANRLGNMFATEFNSPALATYNTAAPIVANEVSGAIVKGGGGVQERLARVKDFSDTKNDSAREGAINAAGSLLGAQYKNHQNGYETSTFRKDFGKRFPVQGGFPTPPGLDPAASTAPDKDGWVDMGNGVRVRQKGG